MIYIHSYIRLVKQSITYLRTYLFTYGQSSTSRLKIWRRDFYLRLPICETKRHQLWCRDLTFFLHVWPWNLFVADKMFRSSLHKTCRRKILFFHIHLMIIDQFWYSTYLYSYGSMPNFDICVCIFFWPTHRRISTHQQSELYIFSFMTNCQKSN